MKWSYTSNTMGTFMGVLFIRTVMFSVAPLQCTAHPDDTESVLKYPTVSCGSPEHATMRQVGLCVLCLVELPFYIASMFIVYHAPAASQEDKEFLVRYKFMFSRYRDDCYYFNACFLTFNLLFAATPAIMPADEPVVASMAMLILCLVNLVLQIRLWPWKIMEINYAYTNLLLMMALILAAGMVGTRAAPVPGGAVDTLIVVSSVFQVAGIVMVIIKHVGGIAWTAYRGKKVAGELEHLGERLAGEWDLIVASLGELELADHEVIIREWSDYDLQAFKKAMDFLDAETQGGALKKSDYKRITSPVAAAKRSTVRLTFGLSAESVEFKEQSSSKPTMKGTESEVQSSVEQPTEDTKSEVQCSSKQTIKGTIPDVIEV